ncbi:MAG TPA: oxidative damage protection protein [Longimicrobiales bacterium]|nr:oxidative damage protection protein [Longimicrobiales bacterium]
MPDISCTRCGETNPQMQKPPLRTQLGERIFSSICQKCWDQWLRYQTALINHNGLDVRDKDAREFLTVNMEAFLFKTGKPEDIDTSQQGKISW